MKKYLFLITVLTAFSYAGLIRPDSGANLSYTYVPFEWEQEPDAISYNLQVSSQQSFDNIIVNIEESTTVYIDTENLDWNETYYWRVRPIYNSSDFGEWFEISNFNIVGKKFPERNADIYNQELIQEGLVAFGGFAGASTDLASAVIDQYGNEIWNDGNLNLILNHINKSGNVYGMSGVEYPLRTGSKINYDNDFLWSAPTADPAYAVDIHEFKQIPNGNYMGFVPDYRQGPIPQGGWTFIYQAIGYEADGVTEEYPWIGMRIVEWDEDGNEVWSWDPFEHFTMEDHDLYGGIWWDFNAGAHDWMHSNAFHFDEEESVIYVSHRHLSRISKIAYPSGEVIWNIGMPAEYNTGSDNICTDLGNSFQHNIQLLDDGSLLFFDNGNLSQMLMGDSNPISRIRRIQVFDNSYCETIWEYELPANLFGLGMGSVQLQDNGNYLMYTFGSGLNQGEPTLREVTPDHEVVWDYQGVNYAAWYRTYKIPSLHPDAFSVIAAEYTVGENDDVIQISDNSLDFIVYNKSGYPQSYKYILSDQMDGGEQMFSYEEDIFELNPYESLELSFIPNDNSQTFTIVSLSIWPVNHSYALKDLFFDVSIDNLIIGDINSDSMINVLDIVLLVDLVLNNEFSQIGDLNNDDVLNVIDVVLLINIILE